VADVMALIQTGIGGSPVAQVFVEERSYDVAAASAAGTFQSEAIGNLTLVAANGAHGAGAGGAHQLAEGETTITREMNRRHLTVRLNLRGRDLASFLDEAQGASTSGPLRPRPLRDRLGRPVREPAACPGAPGGDPADALALMFVLLFGEFGNLRQPALILLCVPLATLGGLLALHLRGMTLNVSSAVGFIALFGVAVLNAIIMMSNLNRWAASLACPARSGHRWCAGTHAPGADDGHRGRARPGAGGHRPRPGQRRSVRWPPWWWAAW
jgi:cobalt-zinc-cadmium resistance protein CzcA